VLKLEGRLIGYKLLMGIVRRANTKLTTPPITNRTAAKSTKPCFNGETPFIFFNSKREVRKVGLRIILLSRNQARLWKLAGGKNLIVSVFLDHFFLELKVRVNQVRQESFKFQEFYAVFALETRHNSSVLYTNGNIGELESGVIDF